MSFYLELFLAYLKIGLFSIGGGRAAIPVVEAVIVREKGWLTMAEFSDVIVISEMTPGPFGINSATFVGIKLGGILGGLISTFACMLAPLIIVVLLAFLYNRFKTISVSKGALLGVRPAVTGLIGSAVLSIIFLAFLGSSMPNANSRFNVTAFMIAAIVTVLLRKYKLNSIMAIFIAGGLGTLCYTFGGVFFV